MKKQTRFLAWVMTLVMVFSCYGGTTVFAVETDTATDRSADVCDTVDHTGWTELTQENIADNMFLYNQHYYLNKEGNYYLGEDLEMGVTMYIWPGDTVNLCLNGYDIEMVNSNRTILNPKNSATLNLYDCGTQVRYYDENGWVTVDSSDDTWETATAAEKAAALATATNPVEVIGGAIYGASSYDKGGAGVFIQNYATFNMYGGNILGCSSSVTGHWGGGVYNYEGTFNMYSGVIAYNSSYTYAGGLFIRTGSTVNMYGGEIAYNYAPTAGAGVYSGGVFTMSGDASIHDNYGSYEGSGFYNAGGGTLNMEDSSRIYNNVSGDGGSAGVYMPSYNSILNMYDDASITGNRSTGIAAGVGLISGVMTISDDAEVSGNYVVESVEIEEIGTLNANDVKLKMLGDVGEKVVDSNVYLYNGKTITFDDYDGNDVYVTSANGLGLVATSVDDAEDEGNLSSDVATYYAVRENDTEVHLVLAQTLASSELTQDYAQGDVDLTELGIFDLFEVDSEYTIIGGTGSGTIDGEDLTVSSVGTFIIQAVTPACNTNPPTTQVSTLTVNPIEVNIDDIGTSGSVVGTTVELDNTSGSIDGDVNGDDVSIDFSVAYGEITSEDYEDGDTGEFAVSIHGISLTGADAGNYYLGTVNSGEGAKVTISETIPHISWPTAVDLIYGDDRDDSDLIGGTVVVQTNGTETTYTTVDGHFEWVSTAVDAAGTHTYEVEFVVSGDYGEDITAALADLTHNVTQVVQPAEVTFTIDNSTLEEGTALSITVTDENGATLSPSNYDYLYYVDGEWVDTEPTAVGSYLIGASVTDNYRHAGTQESTAKQIGAFEIYAVGDSASTTYGVTFTGFTDTTSYDIAGALPQTIHILPTLTDTADGKTYTGWKHSDDTVYDFGSRFPQPEDSVTFTAIEANAEATLSGTIKGTDLESAETTALEGVVVTLMQGAEQVAVTTTDENGEYIFTVPEGRYNLVVTRDQVIRNEITLYVELDGGTVLEPIVIPDIRQNTIFNVASGMTAITVKGMEDLITGDEVRSVKVELSSSSDTAAILAKAAESNLTANNAKLYIDVSIQERDDAGYEEITALDTGELITFYIPLGGIYQGHSEYYVYRYDGETVDVLTRIPNSAGESMTISSDKDLLTLTVQKSAVYGLVFKDTETEVTAATVPSVTYTTEPISTDDIFATILDTTTGDRTYSITSSDGGVATIDGNGKVTVTKIGTFTVTLQVAKSTSDTSAYISTGTLEVTKKEVTISGITCNDKEADTSTTVTLNTTSGVLVGVETGDSVSIDFTADSGATGTIVDTSYYTNTDLTTTGEQTFAVTASGFALTGDDAGNYKISTSSANVASQVTVTASLVYIAWPTAIDTVYGDADSKGTLYGGKVVVYDGTDYIDITKNGSFQWVATLSGGTLEGVDSEDTTIKVDAGTYTYDVEFVETLADNTTSYYTALEAATQMVTQVVQPVAVTFAIGDSTIDDATDVVNDLNVTATPASGTITVADYELWYCDTDGGSWTTVVPTADGSYLLGAAFKTANYRHASTQDYTAKQIGAFTIGAENSATYDVTFTGFTENNISDALPQSIHILPTLTATLEDGSAKYTGWEDEDGIIYDFGERFPQPENDVIFTAIEAPEKVTISGKVTGTDLNDTTGGISRVGVALYQGSTLVDYGETSADAETLGEYSFDVLPGMYNLVVTYNLDTAIEMTAFVDATDDDATEDFTFSELIQNTVQDVAAGLPDMVVDGLENLLDTTQGSEVILAVTTSTDDTIKDEIKAVAAEAGIDEDELKQFFNIDLSSRTGEEPTFSPVLVTDTPLTFYIPLTGIYQGHDEYTVYRYHDGQVQALSETANDDGESIEVSDTNLIIHANKFSLYAIAFDNETVKTTTSSSVLYYTPSITAGDNGSIDSVSPSRATKGTTVTITPEPDDGYMVDTVTVTDRTGNSYTVTDNGNGTYTFTQPSATVTISVTFTTGEEVAGGVSELPFTDVSVDDWFYEDVLYLYNLGIMSGTTATTFSPYSGNSRAMVAQLMYNLEGQPERTEFDFFPDVVVGQWHEPAINWCASHGVVDGYTDGLYRPDRIISRQEFASILYDNCLHFDYDLSALADLSGFADAPSDWAKTYVMWAVEEGVLQGDTNGYLNCSDQLTRCEAAVMFARFLRNVY